MPVIILDDYYKASEFAALYIRRRISDFGAGPDKYFTLGLPTGDTPLAMYKKLVELHNAGEVSFKYVKTFNMDEYCGISRDHPESYNSYMWNNFLRHVDIDPENAHILDGNAVDLVAECNLFEDKIKQAGGIELFVGDIGSDGHIGFNEPGSSFVCRTRMKTLTYETTQANARFFGNDMCKVPTMALTVGVGTVMDANEVLLLVTGEQKALALCKTIEQGGCDLWTASAFQMHAHAMVVCDGEATGELKVNTVKHINRLMPRHLKLAEEPLLSLDN